jgi:hypothetical protein
MSVNFGTRLRYRTLARFELPVFPPCILGYAGPVTPSVALSPCIATVWQFVGCFNNCGPAPVLWLSILIPWFEPAVCSSLGDLITERHLARRQYGRRTATDEKSGKDLGPMAARSRNPQ